MKSPSTRTLLERRLQGLEERLHQACQRAGRARREITLVAITKTVPIEVGALVPELGVFDMGESRPQELWRKAAVLPATISWHLIGHLQRNKVARTLPLVHLIHSVDSLPLLEAIDQEAVKQGRTISVLLEVNASLEPAKNGFALEEVPALLPHLATLRQTHLRGLMTMAAWEEDPRNCRPTFAAVRELAERLRPCLPLSHSCEQLSMGMSNDFEVAIEEGATLVRVGSALFEGLEEG